MESRIQEASAKKICGSHNCTQAVACTYADKTGLDEETVKNIGNGFGAGIVYSLATKDKVKAMKGMRQIMEKFQQRNGATQCKILKGIGTGKVLRECPLCVADASEFLEELLEKE